jgi:hypothetical protein
MLSIMCAIFVVPGTAEARRRRGGAALDRHRTRRWTAAAGEMIRFRPATGPERTLLIASASRWQGSSRSAAKPTSRQTRRPRTALGSPRPGPERTALPFCEAFVTKHGGATLAPGICGLRQLDLSCAFGIGSTTGRRPVGRICSTFSFNRALCVPLHRTSLVRISFHRMDTSNSPRADDWRVHTLFWRHRLGSPAVPSGVDQSTVSGPETRKPWSRNAASTNVALRSNFLTAPVFASEICPLLPMTL